jgi:hypothetical protein
LNALNEAKKTQKPVVAIWSLYLIGKFKEKTGKPIREIHSLLG